MARRDVVDLLLHRHGRTFASELGIRIDRGTPGPLFQLLCFALLASARISTDQAVSAARALEDAGWTTVDKLQASSWEERTRTLNEAGYARYDESTARYLADTADWLQDRYGGDLRRLREEASGDVARVEDLVQGAKGVGRVGAAIFCREVQTVWDELRPYADERVLRTADRLGLGSSVDDLARAAGTDDLATITAALVRVEAAGDDEVDELRRAG
jgi:endonuclease III